jgi:hypothetical protein
MNFFSFYELVEAVSLRTVTGNKYETGITVYDTGWTTERVRFPESADSFQPRSVQTGSRIHPVSYTTDNEGCFPKNNESGA